MLATNHPEELTHVVAVLERELGRAASGRCCRCSRGDVTETFADVTELMRDTGFRPQTSIEDGLRIILSPGIATTTGFEAPMKPTNYSTHHVRWCRHAAVAGLARSPSQAVPAVVRRAFGRSGYDPAVSDTALFERPVVITNNAYRFMVLETACRDRHRGRRAALSRCAATPDLRSRPAPPLRRRATRRRSCWRLRPNHVVRDTPTFLAACREGLAAAEAGHIVTFGVQPERAATEYG